METKHNMTLKKAPAARSFFMFIRIIFLLHQNHLLNFGEGTGSQFVEIDAGSKTLTMEFSNMLTGRHHAIDQHGNCAAANIINSQIHVTSSSKLETDISSWVERIGGD